MHFYLPIIALILATSVLGAYSQVKSDVTDIGRTASILDSAAQSIDGSSLVAALSVQNKFTDLLDAVKKTTSDVDGLQKKLNKKQTHVLLASLTDTQKTIKSVTNQLAKIAKNAESSGVSSIVVDDLSSAKSAVNDVGSAFISKIANPKQKTRVRALINLYQADIRHARAAYQ